MPAVVVEDQVDLAPLAGLALDALEEAQGLAVPVALGAGADDRAVSRTLSAR